MARSSSLFLCILLYVPTSSSDDEDGDEAKNQLVSLFTKDKDLFTHDYIRARNNLVVEPDDHDDVNRPHSGRNINW